MTFESFIQFANEFGLPWALLIAVSIAYWLEVRDRKNNTVPKDIFQNAQDRHGEIIENQHDIIGALAQLVELVKIALFGKE